jgi:hypothetical protein
MRSTQRRLIWILLAVVVLLLFVAVVSVVLFLVLRQRPSAPVSWQDPIAEIVPGDIVPELALYPLAGASELETIDAALDNYNVELANYEYLETAYATLVFGQELTDAQRIGRQIILGRRFAVAEKPERASLSYQQVYDLAVLSPKWNDPARADALLAAGNGWAELGQASQAFMAYDQVYVIAVRSPYLQMANRRDLLNALKLAYADLGDEERAAACQQQIIQLDQEVREPVAYPVPVPDLPIGEGTVSSAEVGDLEEARRQAAFALLNSFSDGSEPPAELVGDLAQALLAEDAAKLALYRQTLESTTQPGKRIDVHWQTIHWLTVKYQVALRGFGLTLVPEWEAQASSIQSALSKAYEDLFFDYEDLVTALPEASLMGPGSYVVRRQMNQSGRLGQYPNYPAQQMADKLREAVANLIASGAGQQLFVDVVAENGGLRFFLNPADQYGLPPQSP